MSIRIKTIVAAAMLLISVGAHSGAVLAVEQNVVSPNGRYVAFEGKAKDGYHDTIWLRDVKTDATVDLLAPDDKKWPGAGATQIVAWLDSARIAFTWHCGTGCTSLELINVETRSHRYFCTDGAFHLSPDRQHAVGQSDNPYEPEDKRGAWL